MADLQGLPGLQRLTEFSFPVHSSRGLEEHARTLAVRFARTHDFLCATFDMAPRVGLLVVSAGDWASYAHPSFPIYALTYYRDGQVVTGGRDSTFWHPFVETIAAAAPDLLSELRAVYGRPDGDIDLTPHTDWWVVHDLGHAFHVQIPYWFPRVWLMEFFADLCLYTYVATHEPAHLPALETLPRLLSQVPASHFRYHTLRDFDTEYVNMELANYLWYHGHFFECAKRAYAASGAAALHHLWNTFVAPNVEAVPDSQVAALLQHVQADVARMMIEWPA